MNSLHNDIYFLGLWIVYGTIYFSPFWVCETIYFAPLHSLQKIYRFANYSKVQKYIILYTNAMQLNYKLLVGGDQDAWWEEIIEVSSSWKPEPSNKDFPPFLFLIFQQERNRVWLSLPLNNFPMKKTKGGKLCLTLQFCNNKPYLTLEDIRDGMKEQTQKREKIQNAGAWQTGEITSS